MQALAAGLQPYAASELRDLSAWLQRPGRQHARGDRGTGEQLQPWDVDYALAGALAERAASEGRGSAGSRRGGAWVHYQARVCVGGGSAAFIGRVFVGQGGG